MKDPVNQILELEEKEDFQAALDAYRIKYKSNPDDFEVWKFYYFFLWYINVEDFPLGLQGFVETNQLDKELKQVGFEGLEKFSTIPEGLFVLGYTINLFPYYFGDYEEWEEKGSQMIDQAADLAPANKIYRMVKIGQQPDWNENEEYQKACRNAAEDVKLKYSGKGLLNSYFHEVLYRKK